VNAVYVQVTPTPYGCKGKSDRRKTEEEKSAK
jgi:hypothetical protein